MIVPFTVVVSTLFESMPVIVMPPLTDSATMSPVVFGDADLLVH